MFLTIEHLGPEYQNTCSAHISFGTIWENFLVRSRSDVASRK